MEDIRKTLPEMPEARRERYITEFKLPEYDSNIITASKHLSDLFEKATAVCNNPKTVSNWIMSDITRVLNEEEMEASQIPFTAEQVGKLVFLILLPLLLLHLKFVSSLFLLLYLLGLLD